MKPKYLNSIYKAPKTMNGERARYWISIGKYPADILIAQESVKVLKMREISREAYIELREESIEKGWE